MVKKVKIPLHFANKENGMYDRGAGIQVTDTITRHVFPNIYIRKFALKPKTGELAQETLEFILDTLEKRETRIKELLEETQKDLATYRAKLL